MSTREKELTPFYRTLTRALKVYADKNSNYKEKQNHFYAVLREHENALEESRIQGRNAEAEDSAEG